MVKKESHLYIIVDTREESTCTRERMSYQDSSVLLADSTRSFGGWRLFLTHSLVGVAVVIASKYSGKEVPHFQKRHTQTTPT